MSEEIVVVESVEPTGQEAEQVKEADVSSTEPAAVQEAEQQDEQKAKKPDAWVQKRIDQLTREKYEARSAVEAAQQERDHYRRLIEAQQGGEQPQAPQPPAQDPYQLAEQIRQQERFNDACNRTLEQGKAEFQDFEAAISNLSLLGNIPPDFLQAVTDLEKPAAVLYALASDLDAAARIMALPPIQQGRELERLALKAAAPKSIPVSKAPAPIAPVDGSASVETDPDKMSMSDWVKWRNGQLSKRN
ncbi:hypothetical protein D3C81_1089010 [compost metagenome]